jgi:hypothetical protein
MSQAAAVCKKYPGLLRPQHPPARLFFRLTILGSVPPICRPPVLR